MNQYIPQLDGLRAIAVLLVIGTHTGYVPGGYVGVDVFFVLSGYLITTILMREHVENRWALKRFYIRRLRRLYPALLVLLLVTLPVGGILAANTGAYAAVAAVTATYLSDFVIVTHALPLGGLSHTWSLAMEEQFYLAWPPFLLFSFRRVSHRVILTTTLGLAVLMLLPLVGGGSSNSGTMFIPFGRGGVLLLGCALAFALNGRTVRHATLVAGASATALALAIVLATNRTDAGAAATLAGVAGSGLIAGILQGGISARALSLRPLVWLGQRSYGVYLWHMPIVYAVADHEVQPSHGSLHVLVPTLAGGIGLAALSFRFVESRFRRPPTSRASDDLADAHRSRDMLVSSSSPALP